MEEKKILSIKNALQNCDLKFLQILPQNTDQFNEYFLFSIEKVYFNVCSLNWILSRGYQPSPQILKQIVEASLRNENLEYLDWLKENFDLSSDLKIQIHRFELKQAYHRKTQKLNVYPRTRRPISEMSFTGDNCRKGGRYLPVVRYEELYHKEDEKSCGTFYFYEPDSTNYLELGNCLIAATKVDAILKLEGFKGGLPYLIKDEKLVQSSSLKVINEFLMNFRPGAFSGLLQEWFDSPKDTTLEDLEHEFDSNKESTQLLKNLNNFFTQILADEEDVDEPIEVIVYDENGIEEEDMEHMNRLYIYGPVNEYHGDWMLGGFDYLDQKICKLANKQGYDTVLLQREPGEKRAVTEILDVRSRKDSYASICKEKFNLPTWETNYPTIWFSNYGFMTY